MNKIVRGSAMLLALALAACGTFELGLAPTETLTPVETTARPTDIAAPTATTAPAADAIVPQAAYFLAAADGQIWRLATDGRTLTQITHERAAIAEFDVSLVDHALAYVTENTLIRVEADGGRRTVLYTGPALTGAEGEGVTSVIHQPLWSPDGRQIAFGLNGVNLLPAAGGPPQLIQASDPVPQVRTEARFYRPYAWSPDGTRLVMQVFFWQEGLVYAVKDLAAEGRPVIEITTACCEPVWSRDGQSLYFFGADTSGYNAPGLWRVNAGTGEAVTLVDGRLPDGQTLNTVLYPAEADDGTLYFLMATQTPDANFNYLYPGQYQMYALPAGAEPGRAPVLIRSDTSAASNVSGAAWSAEAPVGVLLSVIQPDTIPTTGGPLVWLPADGGPAVALPAVGSAPQW